MDHTTPPLTTGDVAAIFAVTTTTVKRWADSGLLPHFKTPGGHYRFNAEDVRALKDSSENVGVA
jgi:excisionase family DNA binding protein